MATDVAASLSTMSSNLGATLGTAGVFIMWIFILLLFFGVAGFLLYVHYNKKSYKIEVVVMRPRAGSNTFDYEQGLMGKQYYDKEKKELRFGIYQAKKKGIQYNNEAVDQKYFVRSFFKGGSKPMLFMAPNDEGWLQPIMMSLDAMEGIKAKVLNSDLSYFQTELDLMDSMFGNKGFFEKYYLLILCILMLIVVAIQWYAASQVHNAAVVNSESVKLLTDTAIKVATFTGGNNSQVVHIG